MRYPRARADGPRLSPLERPLRSAPTAPPDLAVSSGLGADARRNARTGEDMKRILGMTLIVAAMATTPFDAQQAPSASPSPPSFLATVSDSNCGASHQDKMKAGMNARTCVFDCVKSMARFVLVDQNKKVIPILNQEAAGLPLYANKLVLVTGEF